MPEPGDSPVRDLAAAHIAILGLGLMGGSLAYALAGKCAALLGVDPDPQARQLASASGLFSEVRPLAPALSSPVEVWVLAAPARAILAILDEMPAWSGRGGIVLDLGSTKVQITAAMQELPARYDPLGGHPMCGKETGSFASADGGIFHGAPFAFCRLERSSPRAVGFAVALCEALNAHAVWLPAEVHDRQVAATSHLPYLVANALAAATPLDAAPLVGPGFRSAARLAGSPPEMMLDILLTNRVQILDSARRFQAAFESLVSALEDPGDPGSVDLRERLQSGRQKRSDLLRLEEQL